MKIKFNGKLLELKEGATVSDALHELGINIETVLVTKSGALLMDSEKLSNGDELRTVNVVSGG